MKGYNRTGLLLAGILVVLATMLVSVQPVMSVDNATSVSATVSVSSDIDVTLDDGSIAFGSLDPGDNSAATDDPVVVTIYATTNTDTNLSIQGSGDFTYSSYSIGLGNLTYSNATDITYTAMTTSYSQGVPYADWQDITDPTSDTTINIYTNITIPSGQQTGGPYTTTVSIKVGEGAP